MFSSNPYDVAKYRDVTLRSKNDGIQFLTFKCRRCKTIKNIKERKRLGSHIKDGFVCATCKEELSRKSGLNKTALAED